MKKGLPAVVLGGLLIVYFLASYYSDLTADIVSSVYTLSCGLVIIYYGRKELGYRTNWILMAFIPLTWFIGDTLWVIYKHVLMLEPAASNFISSVYLFSNIYILIPTIIYLFKGFKKLHRAKFFLDLVTILIIVLGVASGVLFAEIDYAQYSALEFSLLMAYLTIDIFTIIAIVLLFTSVNPKGMDKAIFFIAGAFLLFVYADFTYIYEALNEAYVANKFSDYLFYLSFYIMVVATLMIKRGRRRYIDAAIRGPENLMNTRIVLYFLAIPLWLFARGNLNLSHLTVITITVIIYQYINVVIQKLFMAESLVAEKMTIMEGLEAMVEARTKALKTTNEALYNKSIEDSLTGLYNRAFLTDYLQAAINEGREITLFYMDLDRFKVINDYHGHELGDKVLIEIAKRLRSTEDEQTITARIGGDEFAMVIGSDKVEDLSAKVVAMTKAIEAPLIIGDFRFTLEMSVGISRYPEDTDTVVEMLRFADLAMYHAKNQESSKDFVLYSTNMIGQIERRNYLELMLRNVNFDRDFQLYYQPKIDLATGQVLGMEALLRWLHPTEGFISPGEFVPIAEETGLILAISDWVFETGMAQVNEWNRRYKTELIVSMNVSPVSFDSYDFIPSLEKLLKSIKVDPSWVEFEITESMAMDSATKSEEIFAALNNLGVFLAIDDFGTGYSSLSYMKRFEVDVLKIARELIMNIENDVNERLIVQAIVAMAKGMHLSVIAEGVETEGQLAILKDLGCHSVQGYYTGRPVDVKTFEASYLKGSMADIPKGLIEKGKQENG